MDWTSHPIKVFPTSGPTHFPFLAAFISAYSAGLIPFLRSFLISEGLSPLTSYSELDHGMVEEEEELPSSRSLLSLSLSPATETVWWLALSSQSPRVAPAVVEAREAVEAMEVRWVVGGRGCGCCWGCWGWWWYVCFCTRGVLFNIRGSLLANIGAGGGAAGGAAEEDEVSSEARIGASEPLEATAVALLPPLWERASEEPWE